MEIIEVVILSDKLTFLFYDNGIFKIYYVDKKNKDEVYYFITTKDDAVSHSAKNRSYDEIIEAIFEFISDKICETIEIDEVLKIEPLKKSKRLKPYLRDYQINSILE